MKKEQLLKICKNRSISHNKKITKKELIELIKNTREILKNEYTQEQSIKSIIIQKYFRRYYIKLLKDCMTKEIVIELLNIYIDNQLFLSKINSKLSIKKCRMDNFPSHISENIVKFALFKKYNIMPNWDTKTGDLDLFNLKIEVKGFSSTGPSSFGPTEEWDILYFVDCTDFINKNFKVYEIRLSSKNNIWKNIKVSKNETIQDQSIQKRRPHIIFSSIKSQIFNYCNIIFDNNIINL